MLVIDDLSFGYSSKNVLDRLSCSIQAGSIHGIMGYNGAGKTTLFNTLYGRHIPKKGSIQWKQKDIQRTDIAFMETYTYFYSHILGQEYLELINRDAKSIEKWGKVFDLPLDQRTDQYSTGMRKKLALAGILLLDRPILLLDEPFSGVDIENNEKIELILQKVKAQGKTIIIASHSIHHLINLCDGISLLEEGKIVQTYEKDQFEQLRQRFKEKVATELDSLLD
ncbi:MAG: ATP-binding cassette domain-containing protein [Bacteroidota bacterium]